MHGILDIRTASLIIEKSSRRISDKIQKFERSVLKLSKCFKINKQYHFNTCRRIVKYTQRYLHIFTFRRSNLSQSELHFPLISCISIVRHSYTWRLWDFDELIHTIACQATFPSSSLINVIQVVTVKFLVLPNDSTDHKTSIKVYYGGRSRFTIILLHIWHVNPMHNKIYRGRAPTSYILQAPTYFQV